MADDQYKEQNKYIFHILISILLALFCSWILTLLIFPIVQWWMNEEISLINRTRILEKNIFTSRGNFSKLWKMD